MIGSLNQRAADVAVPEARRNFRRLALGGHRPATADFDRNYGDLIYANCYWTTADDCDNESHEWKNAEACFCACRPVNKFVLRMVSQAAVVVEAAWDNLPESLYLVGNGFLRCFDQDVELRVVVVVAWNRWR